MVVPLFVFIKKSPRRNPRVVCWGRQARNSQFAWKFPPLFSISAKHYLKMRSSWQCFCLSFFNLPWHFPAICLLANFKLAASRLRQLIAFYNYCFLTNHSFHSLKKNFYSFFCVMFARFLYHVYQKLHFTQSMRFRDFFHVYCCTLLSMLSAIITNHCY